MSLQLLTGNCPSFLRPLSACLEAAALGLLLGGGVGGGGKERLTFLSILTSSYTFIDYVLSLSSSTVSPLKTKSLVFAVVHFHQSSFI
jgi:hypothetical protein